MKVLMIEDDEIKGGEIISFLRISFSGLSVKWEKSFSGGLRALVGNEKFDFLVLDMSLPNHDLGDHDNSGDETFAGRELLNQMKFRRITLPTVVVTMFDTFGKGDSKVSVKELEEKLRERFSPNFVGLVYYSLAQAGWKASLKRYVESIGASYEDPRS